MKSRLHVGISFSVWLPGVKHRMVSQAVFAGAPIMAKVGQVEHRRLILLGGMRNETGMELALN
jgi:hypothetical protein